MKTMQAKNTFQLTLRQAGFKATPGRVEVLELLDKSKKPLSIKDIKQSLKRGELDQATIYRMVNDLKQAGVIRQVDFLHDHAHYELAAHKHHHHLICEKCGKVADISKCNIGALEQEALKIGDFAKINHHSLEFFGICNSCAKKYKIS
jgi:Fur family ferric uptake transcriptional regulator